MEYWRAVETTNSGRPILREGETDVLVDYSVGLYDGKSRVPDKQDGRVFLTSQRIIFIDGKLPTTGSVALELDSIESVKYSSSFLKRSPRVILFLKEPVLDSDLDLELDLDLKSREKEHIVSTWVCPICGYKNHTEGEINEQSEENNNIVCENCGIPASYKQVESSLTVHTETRASNSKTKGEKKEKIPNSCPACTFINHPDMTNCEMCGTPLPNSRILKKSVSSIGQRQLNQRGRSGTTTTTTVVSQSGKRHLHFVQLSFRKSDGTLFLQALQDAVVERRNEQQFLQSSTAGTTVPALSDDRNRENKQQLQHLVHENKLDLVGISGFEKSRENQLLNNDILFNSALNDVNSLISLAKHIERLYQKEKLKSGANNATNLTKGSLSLGNVSTTVKPALSIVDRDKFLNRDAFLDEIARDIYEYATNEFNDTASSGGSGGVMITLIDLYAMYNKAMRIDTGYISPTEMREACERFEKLGLFNLKLMKINDRVLCLSSVHALKFISMKLAHILEEEPGSDILRISQRLNEQSEGSNNWTVGALVEVLQYCIDQGNLVIDEQLSGIYYYINTHWK